VSAPALQTTAAAGAEAPEDDVRLSLLSHLGELRKRLVYAVYAVALGVGASYAFAEKILWWLMQPVLDALARLPGAQVDGPWLAVHDSLEYFFVLLRVSLYAGLFLAAPGVLYQVWAFVAPGLYRRERSLAAPFVLLGTLFFVGGGLFARLLVLPFTLEYLVLGFSHPNLRQVFSIGAELDFVLASILAFGIIFELPLILALLAQIGVVSAAFLAKYRRHAMVLNLVLAAIITPTGDPFNLMLMAGPLIVCYELGIIGARLVERRKRRLDAAEGIAS
jgi:sec-independent protein translocase protein TatC